MKKIILILLIGCLTIGMLSCHSSDEPVIEPEKEIEIGACYEGGMFTISNGDTLEIHNHVFDIPLGSTRYMDIYSRGIRKTVIGGTEEYGYSVVVVDPLEDYWSMLLGELLPVEWGPVTCMKNKPEIERILLMSDIYKQTIAITPFEELQPGSEAVFYIYAVASPETPTPLFLSLVYLRFVD